MDGVELSSLAVITGQVWIGLKNALFKHRRYGVSHCISRSWCFMDVWTSLCNLYELSFSLERRSILKQMESRSGRIKQLRLRCVILSVIGRVTISSLRRM